MQDLPYALMSELDKVAGKGRPPVHLWHPENEKEIDLEILRDGTWNYLGTPIKRRRLIHLFASVLRKEGEAYFLVTPVEKCRIRVEDVPFQIILMEVEGEGITQRLNVVTDMAETVTVGADCPLRICIEGEEWIPYVTVRDGMEARMSRSVYYQLAELLLDREGSLGVWSDGIFFPLMKDCEN